MAGLAIHLGWFGLGRERPPDVADRAAATPFSFIKLSGKISDLRHFNSHQNKFRLRKLNILKLPVAAAAMRRIAPGALARFVVFRPRHSPAE